MLLTNTLGIPFDTFSFFIYRLLSLVVLFFWKWLHYSNDSLTAAGSLIAAYLLARGHYRDRTQTCLHRHEYWE